MFLRILMDAILQRPSALTGTAHIVNVKGQPIPSYKQEAHMESVYQTNTWFT